MMDVNVFIKDKFGNNIDGVVQIGEMADSTSDGIGTFSLPIGIYKARGIAFGFRVKQQVLEVNSNGQEFTLEAVRG